METVPKKTNINVAVIKNTDNCGNVFSLQDQKQLWYGVVWK